MVSDLVEMVPSSVSWSSRVVLKDRRYSVGLACMIRSTWGGRLDANGLDLCCMVLARDATTCGLHVTTTYHEFVLLGVVCCAMNFPALVTIARLANADRGVGIL